MKPPYFIVALDHRNSLRRLINPDHPDKVGEKLLYQWKETALQHLAAAANGVILDPALGLKAWPTLSSSPRPTLILTLEHSGATVVKGEKITQADYSVTQLKNLGAEMVKLLLFYHPRAHSAPHQLELASYLAQQASYEQVGFLLEVLPYQLPGEKNYSPAAVILESAEKIAALNLPLTIYKAPFPGNEKNCRALTQILPCPWVLLSWGTPYPQFKKQLEIAAANGAAGFAVGRALWQEFAALPPLQWADFFRKTAQPRLEEIKAIFTS